VLLKGTTAELPTKTTFENAKEKIRSELMEAIESMKEEITSRFSNAIMHILEKAEKLLIKAFSGKREESAFNAVIEFWNKDLDSDKLSRQLGMLQDIDFNGEKVCDMDSLIGYLRSLSLNMKPLFSEVNKLLKLLLVIPTHRL